MEDKAIAHEAVGIEELPNEVLKNPNLVNMLLYLFQACFQSGIIPSLWSKALIKPIPKSANVDHYVPLNYIQVSLITHLIVTSRIM